MSSIDKTYGDLELYGSQLPRYTENLRNPMFIPSLFFRHADKQRARESAEVITNQGVSRLMGYGTPEAEALAMRLQEDPATTMSRIGGVEGMALKEMEFRKSAGENEMLKTLEVADAVGMSNSNLFKALAQEVGPERAGDIISAKMGANKAEKEDARKVSPFETLINNRDLARDSGQPVKAKLLTKKIAKELHMSESSAGSITPPQARENDEIDSARKRLSTWQGINGKSARDMRVIAGRGEDFYNFNPDQAEEGWAAGLYRKASKQKYGEEPATREAWMKDTVGLEGAKVPVSDKTEMNPSGDINTEKLEHGKIYNLTPWPEVGMFMGKWDENAVPEPAFVEVE